MITNFETNKVYIAKGLSSPSYSDASKSLVTLFEKQQIECEQFPFTQSPFHIWVRDYMPIQVSGGKFVMFRYEPDYLKDYPEYKPDTSAILSELGIQVMRSDIILDGGNIISCGDKVIMTDKIIKENPHYDRNTLIDTISSLLEAEIVLIPQDSYEEYGHSDGMVRYMGNGHVLLNNYCDVDKALRKRLLSALQPHFDITELHYGTYIDRSWAYLNFLHVGQRLFVPNLSSVMGIKRR